MQPRLHSVRSARNCAAIRNAVDLYSYGNTNTYTVQPMLLCFYIICVASWLLVALATSGTIVSQVRIHLRGDPLCLCKYLIKLCTTQYGHWLCIMSTLQKLACGYTLFVVPNVQ